MLDPHIAGCQATSIKVGAFPSQVFRVALAYDEGHAGVASVILKAIAPTWPGDPHGPDREPFFYAELRQRLGLAGPHVYHVGLDPETQVRLIIMEDLSPRYSFPPPTHVWTNEEARCMLRAYARLHARGRACLPRDHQRDRLMPRWEARFDDERLPAMAADLAAWGLWPSLPRLGELLERTRARVAKLGGYAVTLLHNDIYPPNAGLPPDLSQEAALIDWGMLSWGWAELDLAYIFIQPFRAGRAIDRRAALGAYWAQREALEGERWPLEQQLDIQGVADAVLALALVPVAHSRATAPFPQGSAPATYWAAMHGVLAERLAELCQAL